MLETSPFYLNYYLSWSDQASIFDFVVSAYTNKTVLCRFSTTSQAIRASTSYTKKERISRHSIQKVLLCQKPEWWGRMTMICRTASTLLGLCKIFWNMKKSWGHCAEQVESLHVTVSDRNIVVNALWKSYKFSDLSQFGFTKTETCKAKIILKNFGS